MIETQILVVEDEVVTAESIRDKLQRLGYTVLAIASSGEEAMQRAEQLQPDLVLMDIKLEGELDGVQAAELLRSRLDIPIVFLTAYADDRTLQRAKITEPFGYILKPFTVRDLHSTIEMALYRHATDRKLRQSERKLRSIVEQSYDGISLTDEQGLVIEWNRAMARITGLAAKEVLGQPIWDVQFGQGFEAQHTAKGRPRLETSIRQVLQTGQAPWLGRAMEWEHRQPDGTLRFVEGVVFAIPTDKGFMLGSISRDVTARVLAERALQKAHDKLEQRVQERTAELVRTNQALQQAEEKYRDIFENAIEGIFQTTPGGQLITANPAMAHMLGYESPQDLITAVQDIAQDLYLDPKDRQEFKRLMAEQGLVQGFISKVRHKDGRTVWVSESSRTVYDTAGQILYYEGTIEDITARKKAEEQAKEIRRQQDVLNAVLRISVQNLPFEKQLELALDEILSIPWLPLLRQGSIFLVGDEPEVLALRIQQGLEPALVAACAHLPFGRCLCGRAAASGEIEFADCVDERHEICFEGMLPHGHYCVPLRSGDRLLGILVLYLEEGHQRNAQEEGLLQAFANTLVGLIERAQAQKALQQAHDELEIRVEKRTAELAAANRQLQASEAFNRSIIESSNDCIKVLDIEGQLQFMSPGCQELLNIEDIEPYLNKPYEDFWTDIDSHVIEEAISKARDGRMGTFQGHAPTVNGISKWWDVVITPIVNQQGSVERLLAVSRDITERMQAEEALRRYADEQAALYAVTSAVAATLNPDELLPTLLDVVLPVLDADAGWVTLAGSTPDARPRVAASRGIQDAVLDRITARSLRDCPACQPLLSNHDIRGRSSVIVNCPYLPDGLLNGADLSGHICIPLADRGAILGLLTVAWQTTGSHPSSKQVLLTTIGRQVSLALHNAQLYQQARQVDRLRVLNELDTALSATLDPTTVAELTLQRIAAAVGASEGMLIPRTTEADTLSKQVLTLDKGWVDLALAEQQPVWPRLLEQVQAQTQAVLSARERVDRKSDLLKPSVIHNRGSDLLLVPIWSKSELVADLALGGRPADRPFTAEDQALAQAAASRAGQAIRNAQLYDEVKTLLREREETQAQLIHSEKMAALGQLTASIAHEINNPLQSVQVCLNLAEEELADEQRREKIDRYLDLSRTEIARISTIVRRMRDFYQPARPGTQLTDLQAMLETVLALTHKQLQHNDVAVVCEWSELPPIQGNADHLKQVLLNLVLNAIDAMPQGGTLRVRTGLDRITATNGRQSVPAVRIEFSDTGVGMSEEVLSRLFEPFFTTKEQGSGLGLFVSSGIVESHRGQITVESQVGEGTTFTILLPVEQPDEA